MKLINILAFIIVILIIILFPLAIISIWVKDPTFIFKLFATDTIILLLLIFVYMIKKYS